VAGGQGVAQRVRIRSLFLSDIHLGSRACQAERLLHFIRQVEPEHLLLVGDIVDFESLSRVPHWPATHTAVLSRFMQLARRGCRVTYVPGNHDQRMRAHCGRMLQGISIRRNAEHVTADGRRLLVMHGDEFDPLLDRRSALAELGAAAYRSVIRLHTFVNRRRLQRGQAYWPLAGALKRRSERARRYMDRYRDLAVATGRRLGVDGVVCGHIHRAENSDLDGFVYLNTGDWVESCTAVVEHRDGRLELLHPWATAPATNEVALLPLTEAA
jgi:UDP-2,3-diacylglucosamine pyrophosphatase LpxH